MKNFQEPVHCIFNMSESLEKTMRMRTYVLKEILKTEKDYVETLKFLVQVSYYYICFVIEMNFLENCEQKKSLTRLLFCNGCQHKTL